MAEGKSAVMARQLDAAQAITHVGSWEWDMATGVVTWSDELYRIYGMPAQSQPITFDAFLASLLPSERERIRSEIAGAVEQGGRFSYREQIVRPDGTVRVLDTIGEVVADDDGKPIGVIGTCRDVTDEELLARTRQRAERVRAAEREALELLASGTPLEDVLTVIVKLIEELSPRATASILLLDDGKLRHGAAPNLPVDYNRAIDGLAVGPKAGSCGTAAYRREPVFVGDIQTDPLWIGYRQLVEPYGLRACWSSPILNSDGRVLGTFALYFREPVDDSALPRDLVARATHVAGIAIERRQLDDELRALPERIEAAREEERTSIAREIHDELGQALTALKLDIAWIARRMKTGGNGNAEEVTRKLDEMTHSTDDVITTVRRISSELRPGILDSVGLRAALEWQAEDFTRRTGIPCEVKSAVGELQLERSLSTAVFRIFQEALTNVARHASATRVDVYLRLERGMLKLDISDDGVGVPEIAPRNSSLGLLGMRERARRCGGECTIRRRSPRGTIVSVTVPLRFPKAHDHDHELGTG